MPPRSFTDEEEQQIAHIYTVGIHSARAISEKYSCTPNNILYALRRRGIDTSKRFVRKNLYNFDFAAFNKIDSELSAYWLGFIFADGHVRLKPPTLIINLIKTDLNHLAHIKYFLKAEASAKLTKKHASFWATNKQFADRLISLGVLIRKRDPSKLDKEIPYELIRHFIRGYFDGDGCAVKARPEIIFS